MTQNQKKRIAKATIIALVVLMMAVGTYSFYELHPYKTMPRHPEPMSGKIYPINVGHGSFVYVTEQEYSHWWLITNINNYGWFIFLCVAGALQLKFKPFSKWPKQD